jgi:hypothetical protein
MGFLRKLFGGGGGSSTQNMMTFYVRPKRCEEIVVVRLNMMNDLSITDDGNGYFVRKIAKAVRCPFEAELYVDFDSNRKVTQIGVTNGETVEEAVYQQWLAAQPNKTTAG